MNYPSRGRGRGWATKQSAYRNSASIDCPDLARQATDIHLLGDRALYELFRELAEGADLYDTLERYADLAPLAEYIIRQPPKRPRICLSISGVSA